jgi:type IV secretory pathway VirB2 component (pilin)
LARGRDVASVANQVEDQPALQIGARVGYAVSGVLHLLIGWIALQVAWFASAKSADQSGALQTISGSPLGRFTRWVAVLGFLVLGLWQLANALALRTGGEASRWASPPTASIASPDQGMPASEAKADYPRHSSDFAGIDGYYRWVGSTRHRLVQTGRPPKKKRNLR